MTVTAAINGAAGSAAWADALLLSFAQAGYVQAEPAILQPAEPFLDLSGEDIRKSLYLTTRRQRRGTVPAARPHHSGRARLSRLQPRRPACGLQLSRPGVPLSRRAAERVPAGRHRILRPAGPRRGGCRNAGAGAGGDRAFGVTDVEIRTGDVALFNALIDALGLYPVWRRRLIKDFNRKINLAEDIERLTLATAPGRNEYEGVLAALAGSDRKAALALVTDLMSIAGTTNVGGRTVAEIADRFLEQSTLKAGALPRDALGIIKRFLAIAGDPDDAVAKLRALATDAKLDISAAIDQFESRVGFMAARGIDTRKTRFSTSFGRGLDYYTGFEFELHAKGNGTEPLVAGGRYDGLMTQLGSAAPIPAVGFSVWVETLTQLGKPVARGSAA